MPAKEIKELRQAGKLEEALALAKAELDAEPDNIWAKRNISWVYYEYLKLNNSSEKYNEFISWLSEIKKLELPVEEKIVFENLCWQVGKMAFTVVKYYSDEYDKGIRLFEIIQSFHFPKPSEGYTFLFKGIHKSLKDTNAYIEFADWWDFKNFRPEDFQKEKLPNGKEVMAIAEQGYIAYAKHLLPKQTQQGEVLFDKEKAEAFLPILSQIVEDYPQFQYPAYFNAKLLLALGNKDNILESLLPFAKKKRNDFWVWEILAEAFSNDPEKVFACYCKALSCKSPEEMLVNVRQKMAELLIERKYYNEAKTEIKLLVEARNKQGYKIPQQVNSWALQDWYKNANAGRTNYHLYQKYTNLADALLYADIEIVTVLVEFVNRDKKMLNFIGTGNRIGFFKYDRFINDVSIGDVLDIRIQSGENEGLYHLYTAEKTENEKFKSEFIKSVSGKIKIPQGKQFGFLDDAFIHPSYISSRKFKDGDEIQATAIKTYNKEKKQWGWKLI